MATIIDIQKPLSGPPPIFQAKWPSRLDPAFESTCRKTTRFFYNAISIIVFPIGLARLLYSHAKNLAFRAAIPGQVHIDCPIISIWDLAKVLLRFIFNPESFKADLSDYGKETLKFYGGESVAFNTPDGAHIDGAFFKGSKHPEHAIIFIGGNAEQWESGRWISLLKELEASILTINPRGVGKSIGSRTNGYHLDAYSACEWLLQKGFDLDKIVFCGFSMGGAITALGAAEIQKKYPDIGVNAININSFSSLQKEITEISKNMDGIMAPFLRIGSRFLGVEINVKPAWDTLMGQKCIFYNKNDPVVLDPAQLACAVKNNPVGSNHLVTLEPLRDHIPFNSEEEVNAFYDVVCSTLKIEKPSTASATYFGISQFWNQFLEKFRPTKSPHILKTRSLEIITV